MNRKSEAFDAGMKVLANVEQNAGGVLWDDYSSQQNPDRNWSGACYSAVPGNSPGPMTIKHNFIRQVYKIDSGTYSIEVVEDAVNFSALQVEWGNLLKNSSVNSLFLTWEWLHTWWKHLSENRTLHIVTVRYDNELIAIAPLCLVSGRLGFLSPYSTLEFLGMGHVGSDYMDMIVRTGKELPARQALIKYLTEHEYILTFSQVLRTSGFMADFAAQFEQHGWLVSRKATHVCPYINLSGHSWESYLASIGNSHRYNFRRRYKNLQKEFDVVEFEQVHSAAQVKNALSKLIELHNIRWNVRGGSNAFHRPGLISFHEEVSQSAFQQDNLRLYILRLNGQIAAVLYGYKYNNVFYYYQSGFDTLLSRYSVGLVIMGLAIKSAIEEGVEKYDFLHGDEEYKYLWSSEQGELEQFTFVPPTLKGTIYRRGMTLRKLVKRSVRRMLPTPVIEWLVSNK